MTFEQYVGYLEDNGLEILHVETVKCKPVAEAVVIAIKV